MLSQKIIGRKLVAGRFEKTNRYLAVDGSAISTQFYILDHDGNKIPI